MSKLQNRQDCINHVSKVLRALGVHLNPRASEVAEGAVSRCLSAQHNNTKAKCVDALLAKGFTRGAKALLEVHQDDYSQ